MKVRALLAFVLIAATAGCALHSRKDVLADTHATTVRLEMTTLTAQGSCSGTTIGPHLLLSATHCFENLIALKVNGKAVKVVKRVDDGKDHTIIVLDMTFTSWAKLGPEPKQADRVFIWGNPSSFVDFYREGHVAGYVSGAEGRVTLVDLNVWMGDSGSGIFNESG